ncbi:DNA-binding MarR family transcriptional regulator [Murinocardiopsis flavida]|uniref:DNA-binding MarR family transcriptional regulator n=1 Tax=Murinocardiopsis flavida TaxID=645275 RepID=A0A2P8DGC7_9ACTN|nr:MarR family transcriptional regulator [Murinocardiopsis flavida]PSK96258.1 DNA-binding MarR family transcriptional regulator [Murinocardiopsis flavida]
MDGADLERLAGDIGDVRRALMPDFALEALRGLEHNEPSMIQVATLYLLDRSGAPTQRELAERIGRSVSATSRLIDQLVRRGLVARRDDPEDRRARRIVLTETGTAFLRRFERLRAEAQLSLVNDLTADERRLVARAMELLGESARRRSHDHT